MQMILIGKEAHKNAALYYIILVKYNLIYILYLCRSCCTVPLLCLGHVSEYDVISVAGQQDWFPLYSDVHSSNRCKDGCFNSTKQKDIKDQSPLHK
jgi:hypothetical protein